MKRLRILCFSLMLMFGFAGSVMGQTTLVEYTFQGDSFSASTLETGLSANNFSISSGSISHGSATSVDWTGSGVPYVNGSSGWDATESSSGKYFSFTLSLDGADSFDLTNISFLHRATGSGPSALTVTINGTEVETINVADSETVELSEPLNLTGLTSAEVKIIGWDNSSRSTTGGGAFRVDDVKLTGDVEINDPVLAASESSLSFEYVEGSGPSDSQSFELTGTNLSGDDDVMVSAPANFEVSKTEEGGYGNSITYTDYDGSVQDVWVRLASALSEDEYSGDVTIEGGEASDVTVAVSGEVLTPFEIPYSNDFRNEENIGLAEVQGFALNNGTQYGSTADGGYTRISNTGSIETPTIDFTEFDGLELSFALTTFGGNSGQVLSVEISTDDGETYEVAESFNVPESYETFSTSIDLRDDYNFQDGSLDFQ